MKIKRITLCNVGPYLNENIFDFTLSKDKNIILIGGKNGAGKTTFFKSIKTCLYGCKVWGFDAPGKEYYSIVNGLVNFNSAYDSSAKAYVELELVFDDGKQVNNYILHREWVRVKQSLTEYFNIRKNGEIIIGTEEDDFMNYLLSIIPPDMFNFYFFDGESIADFFLGADGNKNFRNAFLKLYGLDTLSIMVENFNRNVKKTDTQKSAYLSYVEARNTLESEERKYEDIKLDIVSLEEKLDLLQIKIKAMQNDYTKQGGIGIAEWKEISAELQKEENSREALNRWLKEVANHYLPFVILAPNLERLVEELTEAQLNEKNEILISSIQSDSFVSSLADFLARESAETLSASSFVEFLVTSFATSKEEKIFDYSMNQINRIMSQAYEKIDFDEIQIKNAIKKINSSIRKSKQLRDKLTASSIDGYEAFVTEREKVEKEIAEITGSLELKRRELEMQQMRVDEVAKVFAKMKEAYELVLKNKSIGDLSERAAATFARLEETLVLRQAEILQTEFMKCFTSIINKDNFIDGIIVDKNITVIPYKYINVTKAQAKNYLLVNKEFIPMFNDSSIYTQLQQLESGMLESARLPSPIKAPFSQGERQVYIMSIYLALLKTSRKDIPFFIDTPFARIDSNHRENIVTEFFNKINNQLFILSTDEEIIGRYKELMDSYISDLYLLDISQYGRTKIYSNRYFDYGI